MATAKTNTTTKTADAVSEDKNLGARVTDGARDYVARTAKTAKERTDSAYERVGEFNKGVESTMTRAVTGYISFLNGVARVSHDNVKTALDTVEKVAAAKTFTEAAQIQVDYVRDTTSANYETARVAFEDAREALTDGAKTLNERMTSFWKSENKAA